MHAHRLGVSVDFGELETGADDVEAREGGDIVYVGRASFRMEVEGVAVPVPLPRTGTEPHGGEAARTSDAFIVAVPSRSWGRTEDDLPVLGELGALDWQPLAIARERWAPNRTVLLGIMGAALGVGVLLPALWRTGTEHNGGRASSAVVHSLAAPASSAAPSAVPATAAPAMPSPASPAPSLATLPAPEPPATPSADAIVAPPVDPRKPEEVPAHALAKVAAPNPAPVAVAVTKKSATKLDTVPPAMAMAGTATTTATAASAVRTATPAPAPSRAPLVRAKAPGSISPVNGSLAAAPTRRDPVEPPSQAGDHWVDPWAE